MDQQEEQVQQVPLVRQEQLGLVVQQVPLVPLEVWVQLEEQDQQETQVTQVPLAHLEHQDNVDLKDSQVLLVYKDLQAHLALLLGEDLAEQVHQVPEGQQEQLDYRETMALQEAPEQLVEAGPPVALEQQALQAQLVLLEDVVCQGELVLQAILETPVQLEEQEHRDHQVQVDFQAEMEILATLEQQEYLDALDQQDYLEVMVGPEFQEILVLLEPRDLLVNQEVMVSLGNPVGMDKMADQDHQGQVVQQEAQVL